MSIEFYIIQDWIGNVLFKSKTLEEAENFYFSKDDDEQQDLLIVGVDKYGNIVAPNFY